LRGDQTKWSPQGRPPPLSRTRDLPVHLPALATSSTPAHVQKRLRSPQTLSTRPICGQNLWSCVQAAGNAADSREYGWFHSLLVTNAIVCGAFLSALSVFDILPVSIARISSRIAIIASQKRSSSCFDSLSVGSIMNVPGTGND